MDYQYQKALDILKDDGVIIYPTDTTYGIGCKITCDQAINKIFRIKGRDFNKPLSIACCDLTMANEYADFDNVSSDFLEAVYPGAVTLLLYKKKTVSDRISASSTKVGIRIPDYPPLLELIETLGVPIVTTSANISGKPDPITADDIGIHADFIIKNECVHKKPSTIIDIEQGIIVRTGANASLYQDMINKYLI